MCRRDGLGDEPHGWRGELSEQDANLSPVMNMDTRSKSAGGSSNLRFAAAIAIALALVWFAGDYFWASAVKILGRANHCPWGNVLTAKRDINRLSAQAFEAGREISVEEFDERLGIERLSSPAGKFWIKRSGATFDGVKLLAFLLAEHQWMLDFNPAEAPAAGDVVIDCGAHVGTFTDMALKRGASKVLAIEPDPIHAECLRRNFADDVRDGRVVIVEKALWSEPGTMTLELATKNSGMNSLVREVGQDTIEVQVTTLDELSSDLGLDRVDYIKLDIEGAEKPALLGARGVITRFKPRLMIESSDSEEGTVPPSFIEEITPGYSATCGPCEALAGTNFTVIVPYVLYYAAASPRD